MLVTRSSFEAVKERLLLPGVKALDTETTGLKAYQGDRLFSIIIATVGDVYYFNFQYYPGVENEVVLTKEHKESLQDVLRVEDQFWYMHNAKFDMHMLAQEGLYPHGTVFCTMAQARLLRNDLMSYSLDALAKRWLKEEKSDAVADYCDKNKLYVMVTPPGKKQKKRHRFYHKVPLEVIGPYAEKDAVLTYRLGEFIRAGIMQLDGKRTKKASSLHEVSLNETKLTKTLFRMERLGILIDRKYTEDARDYEATRLATARAKFKEETGEDLTDSGAFLNKIYKARGIELPKTEKGSASCTDSWLAKEGSELSKIIRMGRDSEKRLGTYYSNFLTLCDENDRIHATFWQSGTKTGRLSASEPNLQNLTKDEAETEDNPYRVRACFIPDPDFCFFAPDYDQMEYRLMLSYAGEDAVIDQVLAGMDVHQATADILGVGRQEAKTINFALIYGAGESLLAENLGCSLAEAKEKKAHYFAKLTKVARLVQTIRRVAESSGYTFNWFGRRYSYPDPRLSYRAPNHLIQGGCSEVMKIGLNRLDELLSNKRSFLNSTVHDEAIICLHKSELSLAEPIVEILSTVYTEGRLPLSVSPAYSWRNLADKVDGYPTL